MARRATTSFLPPGASVPVGQGAVLPDDHPTVALAPGLFEDVDAAAERNAQPTPSLRPGQTASSKAEADDAATRRAAAVEKGRATKKARAEEQARLDAEGKPAPPPPAS
jgi:hypothetical protein